MRDGEERLYQRYAGLSRTIQTPISIVFTFLISEINQLPR